jgi:hypothetical protein
MAYLASMRADGESEIDMMRACNLCDETQVRLLLMTWDAPSPLPGEPPASREYVAEIERCNRALGAENDRLRGHLETVGMHLHKVDRDKPGNAAETIRLLADECERALKGDV